MHMPTPLRWRGGVGWGEKGGEERGEKKMFEKEEIGGNKKKGGGEWGAVRERDAGMLGGCARYVQSWRCRSWSSDFIFNNSGRVRWS